jgi:hypothetical protein
VRLAEKTGVSRSTPNTPEIMSFVRGVFGVRFEMRFEWEADWWPTDAQEVAETLPGYYNNLLHSLEKLRGGDELRSGLAYLRGCR